MERKSAAKDLFARAHRLSVKAREAFLEEACGGGAELRLEVQRMLVDMEKADSFFAEDEGVTMKADVFDATYAETEGDQIGPYTLRQQIGEGGFGTVWMAEQSEPISRMVAVKVVKAGMDTKQVLSRFEAERQALAMMEHPNIAKVLDAGATPNGRPYFAMELVKGVPVTEFCDQQKFDSQRRLKLFQDVCSAVNHAHQKGIIHRDLKPSNIMVTLEADRPVVKVIDFGIAKATHTKLTEKTLFTRFEQFLGTPVYMSPEQAALSNLDVDTRSDIYSLGVLLYELLAGAPPFDQKSLLSAGYDEMRRIIAEDEPPKPSTRLTQMQASTTNVTESGSTPRKKHPVNANSLKGEIDWIVMKAIEKDRARRYETASALGRDIGCYLANEPVHAAAPSKLYKVRKFTRRHKAAIGAAAAMVLLLLGGAASTSWQAIRATSEKDRAVEAEALAEVRLGDSEAARDDAERARKKAEVSEALAERRLEETEAARTEAEQFSNVLRNTLEAQMFGFWIVDLEETPGLSRQEIDAALEEFAKEQPVGSPKELAERISKEVAPSDQATRALLGGLTFEIKKGKITLYAPDRAETGVFSLKSSGKADNTLIMEVPGEIENSQVTIERDRLILKHGETMILKRISQEAFAKRRSEDKEVAGLVENEVLPISFEDAQLKRHLSAAAAMDSEQFAKFASGDVVNPEAITSEGGTLTDHLMFGTLTPREGQEFFFRFKGPADPAKIGEALNPASRELVSVIHPEYITSLEFEIKGSTLVGQVEFTATNGIYEGAVGFEAVHAGSEEAGWTINAFILERDGSRLERKGKEGEWKRKTAAPNGGNEVAP